jgi:hypothetical protein
LKKLLQTVYVATVTDNNIYEALDIEWDDFEDSIQYIAGKSISAEYIITRNKADFRNSTIEIVTPEQFFNYTWDKPSGL